MKYKSYELEEVIEKYDQGRRPLSTLVRNKMDKIYPYYGANGIIDYVDNYIFDGDYLLLAEDGTVLVDDKYPVIYRVNGKFWVSNHAHIFKAKEEIVLQEYLYYCLKQTVIKDKITGTTQLKLSQANMNKIKINIPDLETQKKVVNILTSLDKKIDLNNKIHDNLFELILNKLRNILEQSTKGKVRDLGIIQGGYAFKSKNLKDEVTNNKIIKIKNILVNTVDTVNTQYVDDEIALKVDQKFKLKEGNVIIAMTGAEIGKTGYMYGKNNYLLNQRVGVVKGNSRINAFYLNILFLTQELQNLIKSKGHGSAQPNISTSDIEALDIKIPSNDVLTDFYNSFNKMYEKMINIKNENLNLIGIRDSLLPKLMIGDINLDNIEINL